jgi:hypothetical protein
MAHELKTYIEACNKSADASRRPLAILVIAYVVVFCAIWNARNNSWQNSFVRSGGAALQWLALSPEQQSHVSKDRRFAAGREFVEVYGMDDPVLLAWAIEKVRATQVESTLFFKLPFFNISVHINDLGVLAGLAFVLLLGWYRQCLVHHLVAMRVTLRSDAATADTAQTRELLAIHQFLTFPVPDAVGVRAAQATQLLLLTPAVLFQAYLLWSNWSTRQLGLVLGSAYAVPILSLSALFLVVLVVLIVSCHRWLRLIAREWRGS